MPTCPICLKPLNTVRQREGLYYCCPNCNGRALTIPQIRRVLGDRLAVRLLRLTKLNRTSSRHCCPFCSQLMIVINTQEPPLELDACQPCNIVWFDAPTYEIVPEGTAVESTNAMSLLSTEIFATNRLKEMKEREEAEREDQKKKKRRK